MAFLNLNDPHIGDPAPQELSHRVGATPAWKEPLLAGLQALFDGLHTLAGARHGACFMVGGRTEAAAKCEPILRALAIEGGFLHTGAPGSGHFVKLVHNGIKFGMLQSIGEGLNFFEIAI
jgi:hypothetical protein